jgi:RHS repeat-associated protein
MLRFCTVIGFAFVCFSEGSGVAANQLVSVMQTAAPNPSHNTTAYGFDPNGNLTSWTDVNGHTTQNGFDLANELNSEILPAGGPTQTHTYDSAGNLTSLLDFNGKTTSYTYDSLNRLLTVTPDSTLGDVATSFTYTSTSRRATMTDASGTTTYTYDGSDRLITKATPEGTLNYTYDSAGNLASLASSNANGASVSYTWGALNKLASVVDNRLPSGQNTTTYTYDVNENLATVTYPNGLQATLAYDGLSRITGFNSGKTSYSYQLGATGNRTSVQESTGRSLNWNYDGIFRLTNENISNDPTGNNGGVGYGLDPVGNRLALSSGLAKILSSTSSFDANDRLASETYDNNGNTLTSGGKVFKYDFANRLKSMNSGAVTLVYDGDGNRVAKTVAGATTQYLVDDLNPTGLPQVVDELVNGSVQRTYTYGSQRISQYQNISGPWTPSFYGYDGGFHVRLLTDITGAVTDTYDYDAFGSLVNSTGSTPNNYLYRGEQWDAHLGLYYLRARYYNPGTGRFLSRDQHQNTVKHPRTLHRYLYSSSDPVNRKDPKGLEDDLEYTEVTKSEANIARLLGRSLKEVKNAIHALKRDIAFEGNPDVFIDINNFNVFVETYSGDVGDLLANLFDYLD